MKKLLAIICSIASICIITSCGKNREVSASDGPNFREIHEDIHFHFDEVAVDGDKYLILERDRNNPHEGFGFMALKGADIKKNQDSIKAYLKTILDVQLMLLDLQGFKNDSLINEIFLKNHAISKSPLY